MFKVEHLFRRSNIMKIPNVQDGKNKMDLGSKEEVGFIHDQKKVNPPQNKILKGFSCLFPRPAKT